MTKEMEIKDYEDLSKASFDKLTKLLHVAMDYKSEAYLEYLNAQIRVENIKKEIRSRDESEPVSDNVFANL